MENIDNNRMKLGASPGDRPQKLKNTFYKS
jgi:hypothetical protein